MVEFLMANLKQSEYLDEKNLKMAFDFFDENHDGSISLTELKRIFSDIDEEELVEKIISINDANNDGEVTFSLR